MLLAPSASKQMGPLSAEAMDDLLRRMQATFKQIERSQGSRVHLPKAELEMMKLFELARDFMMTVLRSESGDRVGLRGIFGGDCTRISTVRAVLETTRLSEAAREDQRRGSCLSACKSVETVLGDLGLGVALRLAQEMQRTALAASLTLPAGDVPFAKAEAVVEELVRPQPISEPSLDDSRGPHEAESPPSKENQTETRSHASLWVAALVTAVQAKHAIVELDNIELNKPLPPETVGVNTSAESALPTPAQLEPAQAETDLEPVCGQDLADGTMHCEPSSNKSELSNDSHVVKLACEPEVLDEIIHLPSLEQSIAPRHQQTLAKPQSDKENKSVEVNRFVPKDGIVFHNRCQGVFRFPFDQPDKVSKKNESLDTGIAHHELSEPMHEPEPETPCSDLLVKNQSTPPIKQFFMPEARRLSVPELPLAKQFFKPEARRLSVPELPLARPSAVPEFPLPRQRSTARQALPTKMRQSQTSGCINSMRNSPGLTRIPNPAAARNRSTSSSGVLRRSHSSSAVFGCPQKNNAQQCSLPCKEEAFAELPADVRKTLAALEPSHHMLIRELFAHYVGPGGMSAGSGLGLSKFRRFLRDCGLLANEADAGPSQCAGVESTLSAAEADLTLARAAGTVCPGMAPRLRTWGAFGQALADIAARASPELAHMPDQALDVLCCEVLVPLGKRCLQDVAQDVRAAVRVLAEREVGALLRRCQHGLGAVFVGYASGVGSPHPYRQGHWTAKDVSRFAADAGLAADLSHSLLQRIFGACASYEASSGRGEDDKVSFDGFLLALVATSQRIYAKSAHSPHRSLATVLRRISVQLPGHHDVTAAAREALR